MWSALCIALLGAGLLLVVATEHTESLSWRTDGAGDRFAYEIAVDTESGTIVSNVPGVRDVTGDLAGQEFFISGHSGEGRVAITVTDPTGATVIDEVVGPAQSFQYPDATSDEAGFLVVAAEYPAEIPAPGGAVVFVIEAEVALRNVGDQTVTGFSIEPYGNEGITHLDSGRPDSCTRVTTPLELTRGSVLRCTYRVELTGEPGLVEQSVATVHTTGGEWSSDPIDVAIVEPGPPHPEPPPRVESTLAEPGPMPLRGLLATDVPGVYRVTLESTAGSTGFDFSMSAERRSRGARFGKLSPNRELALSFLGAAALAGVTIRLSTVWQRVSGLVLAVTGIAVPLAVLATENDQWYWNPGSHLIWVVALALAGLGASVLAAPGPVRGSDRPPPLVAVAGLSVLGLVTLTFVLLTAALSPAYGGDWLGGDYVGYNGDYMVMGIHVYSLVVATPLVALTSGLWTVATPRRGRAEPPRGPSPAGPTARQVALRGPGTHRGTDATADRGDGSPTA